MTLFDECKNALDADFSLVEGLRERQAMDILKEYPFHSGSIEWSKICFTDYDVFDDVFSKKEIINNMVFVFTDDSSIPIFRSNLNLIAENIYDVKALSPKLFIFNNEIIIQPLFPTEIFRFGTKVDS